MYKIYTNSENVPDCIVSGLLHCTDTFQFVISPSEADFFAFPCQYQVAYEYTDYEYSMHGLNQSIRSVIVEKFETIKRLSEQYGKPLICFYLRDAVKPLPVDNAIVFRSSLLRSTREHNEFAYPANGRPLLKDPRREYNEFLSWTTLPSVGFVGQSITPNIPLKTAVKEKANNLLKMAGFNPPFIFKYNFGYLQRRNSIIQLSSNEKVKFDFKITFNADYFNDNSRFFYSDNLLTHQYALTASGHGNYSYRFYEIMEAGRIPLFINTDCVLPHEELIDYKDMLVWVEAHETNDIVNKLLDYHNAHIGSLLEDKQHAIKNTWQTYLQGNNFYKYLPHYLRHFS